MRLSNIFIILFLASLVLFVPLSRQEQEYKLIPFEQKIVVVNIQNTKLIVTSNRVDNSPFEMEIYYLNPETNLEETIQSSLPFTGENSFPIDLKGFYKIILDSEVLSTITIATEGVPDATIFIVSITMLLAIGAQIQKQFSRSFDY